MKGIVQPAFCLLSIKADSEFNNAVGLKQFSNTVSDLLAAQLPVNQKLCENIFVSTGNHFNDASPIFFFYTPFYSFVSESPRWLYSQKRIEEADRVMGRIARWNKCPENLEGIVVKTVGLKSYFPPLPTETALSSL